MEMDLSANTALVPLLILTPFFAERLDLMAEPMEWRRTFVVPPGSHFVHCKCDEHDSHPGGRAGLFVWRVGRPRIAPPQQTVDSGNGLNGRPSTAD